MHPSKKTEAKENDPWNQEQGNQINTKMKLTKSRTLTERKKVKTYRKHKWKDKKMRNLEKKNGGL